MSHDNVMTRTNRFLNIYGFILILFFLGSIYSIYISSNIGYLSGEIYFFGVVVSLWYLATGIGILARKKWGYYLFKSFLYILFIAFPVGTLISFYSLKYIRANTITNQFN